MPLLDSFLRESARVSAFESSQPLKFLLESGVADIPPAGVRRQALVPFAFSDGLTISKGDWVCVPHRSMMRDSAYFEDPLQFDAFRFAKGLRAESQTPGQSPKLVDASDTWLVWGSGKILW